MTGKGPAKLEGKAEQYRIMVWESDPLKFLELKVTRNSVIPALYFEFICALAREGTCVE